MLAHPFFASLDLATLLATPPPHFADAPAEPAVDAIYNADDDDDDDGNGDAEKGDRVGALGQPHDALEAAHAAVVAAREVQRKAEAIVARAASQSQSLSAPSSSSSSSSSSAASSVASPSSAGRASVSAVGSGSAAPTYSPWARFLSAGEEVVYTEMLEKGRGLFSKRRQLILTTAPRFRYIDVAKMEQKGTIEWHADLTVELKDSRNFIVHTPNIGREWYFECLSGEGARAWVEIVNQMRRH